MKKELEKKLQTYKQIINFLDSNFYNFGLGILSVLIVIIASLASYLGIGEYTLMNAVIKPLLLGSIGIITLIVSIPVSNIIRNKYFKLEKQIEKINSKKKNIYKERKVKILKREKEIKNTQENKKAKLFIQSSIILNFINKDVFLEWKNYLNATINDDESIIFIKNLFYYLNLLNSDKDMEDVIKIIEDNNISLDIIELLIYFSINGRELKKCWNLKHPDTIKENKKGRIKSS